MLKVCMSLEKSTWSHLIHKMFCLISLVLHSRLLVANDIKNSLHIIIAIAISVIYYIV